MPTLLVLGYLAERAGVWWGGDGGTASPYFFV